MKKPQHIHFVGIKGVGMTPLAIIAKEAGITVTGSDVADAFITDSILAASGITPFVDFDTSHIAGADLVITTGAHGGFDNVETAHAQKTGVPVLTQGQAVGEFMEGSVLGRTFTGISVAGTHGKTTTTAMIATVLESAGRNPSWIVGTSTIASLGASGHFGDGKYFVAEADEYANEPIHDRRAKFLFQRPHIAVVTNIEHDHPDMYPTIEHVYEAFSHLVKNLPTDGIVVACGDDAGVRQVLQRTDAKAYTYGFTKDNRYRIVDLYSSPEGSTWKVEQDGQAVSLRLPIPGEHNVLNATAAYIVGVLCGVAAKDVATGLQTFSGTKRRMEYIGQLADGALLYDDYAHHPTEIQKTLLAIREKYPNKKIVCIFQPHTFSRTKLLFDQFVDSLSLANTVVLTDIYASKREAFDSSVSSQDLVEKLKHKTQAFLARKLADVVKYIHQSQFGEDTIILTMGAGDIYQIAQIVLERESAPHSF